MLEETSICVVVEMLRCYQQYSIKNITSTEVFDQLTSKNYLTFTGKMETNLINPRSDPKNEQQEVNPAQPSNSTTTAAEFEKASQIMDKRALKVPKV